MPGPGEVDHILLWSEKTLDLFYFDESLVAHKETFFIFGNNSHVWISSFVRQPERVRQLFSTFWCL